MLFSIHRVSELNLSIMSDSDNIDARSSWSGPDKDETEAFSDAMNFRYCLLQCGQHFFRQCGRFGHTCKQGLFVYWMLPLQLVLYSLFLFLPNN
uniref:Uncharacterized protein n=1 Tax=Aegilops tauschii subsp. strangulata TaxID=200361 RepID=A0A452Y1Z6_AEGTS